MKQILASWEALDSRRRMIVTGATIAVFVAILALSAITSRPNMALLYAGLDPAQSGEIVAALEKQGVAYEVRGDSIQVDSRRRDELRMMLASEGLPKLNGTGYELLDSLSGFGTTSQMFDAAYWRAKEGELARTILANPDVRSARVHIAPVAATSFRNDARPTASVTVTTNSGGFSAQQATALQFLVASAVPRMRPEDVSVIDSVNGLIATGAKTPNQLGDDRAAELRRNVERLLEARVGYGNAVVELSVQTVSEREAITERRFDPQGRVIISTENTETSKQADATKPPNVTVASNLPDGDAANNGRSQSQASETRERTNYEVSETTRELLRSPGDIKRITVAVLVDGVAGTDASGQAAITPRSQEELDSLHDLVASAVGYDEARGDVITIRSMPFVPLGAHAGTEATGGLFAGQTIDVMRLIAIAALVIVALVLGLFVMRPLLLGKRDLNTVPDRAQLANASDGERAATAEAEDLPPKIVPLNMQEIQLPEEAASSRGQDGNEPVARLKRLIEERHTESVEILRGWMESNEGRA
ncbi:flagellar basal-body MS-ring/collar protein FliF [Paenirhodobacter populi]|uniref:flagellar basal-body MS-ring/collar protein FliF n=1 Tax=Paenirhodobacter populi TaxID=2306993 RepID=UPI000FE35BF0|nr:flagellar basal-body MS-ring/collar protein FliF [Sinirhodobacter populi]RWR08648.1 flagellar M-ring protein FliF [Sinirhodobacter populi]